MWILQILSSINLKNIHSYYTMSNPKCQLIKLVTGLRKRKRHTSQSERRLNTRAFPLHFLIQICNSMSENALFYICLPSLQVDCKPNSTINLLMVVCQKSPPLVFEAFPWWKYQPGMCQNDGALRGSITRTSPGPLCAEDEFWHQSSLQWDRQPCHLCFKVPAAYLCLPGCVLCSFLLDCILLL